MWWMAAAAAAPMIANMLMPKPDNPNLQQAAPGQNPAMAGYQEKMMQDAFNPNSQAFQMASDQSMNQVNSELSKLGLAHSSMGVNAIQNSQAQLARNWQMDAAQREGAALNNMNSATSIQNQANQFNSNIANQQAQNYYNQQMMNRQNMIQGIGALGSAGAQMYGMRNPSSGVPSQYGATPYSAPGTGYLGANTNFQTDPSLYGNGY